jgi:hypothetical protein
MDTLPYYRVLLWIKHPSINPNEITRCIGFSPSVAWMAGERHVTPTGMMLPGIRDYTYWCATQEALADRAFFQGVMDVVRRVEYADDFVNDLISTGGTVNIIVHLPGVINIGDVINASDLSALARLKINLGIEVFPNFGPPKP